MYRYQHYQYNSQETSNNILRRLCYSFEILCSTPANLRKISAPSNDDVLKAVPLGSVTFEQEGYWLISKQPLSKQKHSIAK